MLLAPKPLASSFCVAARTAPAAQNGTSPCTNCSDNIASCPCTVAAVLGLA